MTMAKITITAINPSGAMYEVAAASDGHVATDGIGRDASADSGRWGYDRLRVGMGS